MKECKHCNLTVNTDKERCPICKNALEGETPTNFVSEFPALVPLKRNVVLKRIFNIIFVAIVGFFAISLIFTVILPEYNAWWSFFLGLSVVSAFVVVRNTVLSSKTLARRICTASFLAVGAAILIDGLFLHLLHETPELNIPWSLLFVLPFVPSGVIIAYIALMFANRKSMSDFYVYVFFEMLLNLVPLLVYHIWGIGYRHVVYSCVILNIATIGLLCAFNLKSVTEEIRKKFHI